MVTHGEIKKLVEFQEKIQAEVGKAKMEVPVYVPPAELVEEIKAYGEEKLKAALMDADKKHREAMVDKVKEEIATVFSEKYPDNAADVAYITQKLIKAVVRRTISVDKIRPDGRQLNEVRPISCEVGILDRPHARIIIIISIVFLVGSVALIPFIGMEFQPTYDSGEFSISAIAPSNVSVERMLLAAKALGFDSLWAGIKWQSDFFNRLITYFNLPAGFIPVAVLSFGKPGEKKVQVERYDEKKVHHGKF